MQDGMQDGDLHIVEDVLEKIDKFEPSDSSGSSGSSGTSERYVSNLLNDFHNRMNFITSSNILHDSKRFKREKYDDDQDHSEHSGHSDCSHTHYETYAENDDAYNDDIDANSDYNYRYEEEHDTGDYNINIRLLHLENAMRAFKKFTIDAIMDINDRLAKISNIVEKTTDDKKY